MTDADALSAVALGAELEHETTDAMLRRGWIERDGCLSDAGLAALIEHETREAVDDLRWRVAQIVVLAVDAGLVTARYAEDATGAGLDALRRMASDGGAL